MSKEDVLLVFGYLAKRLLQIDLIDLEEDCLKYHLDVNQIKEKIDEINEDLKDF